MSDPKDIAIELDDVEVRFGAVRALRGIDMEIARGSEDVGPPIRPSFS